MVASNGSGTLGSPLWLRKVWHRLQTESQELHGGSKRHLNAKKLPSKGGKNSCAKL